MKRPLKIFFAACLTFCVLIYLTWRLVWTIPYGSGAASLAAAWVLMLVELAGNAELLAFFWLYAAKAAPAGKGAPAEGPVDVFVTTCGEPEALVRRTLAACTAMRCGGGFTVWLLDDADRPEMARLAARAGVRYLTRPDRSNAKAGNLNAALEKTCAPFIAVFDADMAPSPSFLEKTMALMTEGVGFVQTPQSFRNRDLFQKAYGPGNGIPNEQDFFYRSIEPARDGVNAVVLAGSNMLIRRQALDQIGGFVTETLTEDFATGIALQKKGWRGAASAEELAEGLAPESLGALIRQRKRWARGCIQSGKRAGLLFRRGLTLRQRVSYWMAVGYWFFPVRRLIYLLVPLLPPLFGVTVVRSDLASVLAFSLPTMALVAVGLPVFSGRTRTVGWSMLYETCLTPFLLFPVLAELLGIGRKEFQVTDKSGRPDWRFGMLIPHASAALVILAALAASFRFGAVEGFLRYGMTLVWNLFHLDLVLEGLLFVLSCRRQRPGGTEGGLGHRIAKRELAAWRLPRFLRTLFRSK